MQRDQPPDGGPGRRVPPVALLVALSAINTIALNMFVPSMPGMADVFDTSPAAVQLTLSLYLAGACTLSAWYAMIAGLPYVLVDVLGGPPTD